MRISLKLWISVIGTVSAEIQTEKFEDGIHFSQWSGKKIFGHLGQNETEFKIDNHVHQSMNKSFRESYQ